MRAWLLCFALLMSLSPIVGAGTSADPEVADPAADVAGPAGPACPPTGCNAAPQFIDLRAMWVEQTETDLVFAIQIAGNHNANAYGEARFVAHFTIGGTEYMAGLAAGRSSTSGGDDSMTLLGVAREAGFESDHVRIVAPLSAVGNPAGVVSGLFATTELDFGDQNDNTFSDRAPDADFGRDFALAETAPVMGAINITGLPVELRFNSTEPTDIMQAHNWTSPGGNLTWAVVGNVTGSFNFTIVDAANATTTIACPCVNETDAWLGAPAGNWTILAEGTGFSGEVTLTIAEVERMPPASSTESPVAPNGTDDAPIDAESPGLGALAVLGVFAIAVLARRR